MIFGRVFERKRFALINLYAMSYTREEKIVCIQRCCGGHSFHKVSDMFSLTFPYRPKPSHNGNQRFITTGCVQYHRRGMRLTRPESEKEYVVLAANATDPYLSVREMSMMTGVPRETVRRILRKHNLKSYKVSHHHHYDREMRPFHIAYHIYG
jgi:excisionase family DNA binding protein